MKYTEFKTWAQDQINALPIYYAFGNKQFNEMLAEHFNNMTMEDAKQKLYSTGSGGYYLRSDAGRIRDTFQEINDTQARLIQEDATGDGFIYQMFVYELANHEYSVTGDVSETLDAVGVSAEDLNENHALTAGLNKAIKTLLAVEEQPAGADPKK